MDKVKPILTLMNMSRNLDKDEEENMVYARKYRGMIAYHLYLVAYHIDIMFTICLYACFKQTPKNHT